MHQYLPAEQDEIPDLPVFFCVRPLDPHDRSHPWRRLATKR